MYQPGYRYEWTAKQSGYSPLVSYVTLHVTAPDGRTFWRGSCASTACMLGEAVRSLLDRLPF